MRIRTIKPEFWRHAVMAQLPPETQLLALALLNMADDEGYFEADPRIVRGEVMPFREDLRSISGGLLELSRVGWVSLRKTIGHGQVGVLVNFVRHQRVSHPAKSKLRVYFDASGSLEVLASASAGPPEDVRREQGTGNREGNREVEEEGASSSSAGKTPLQFDLLPPDPAKSVESWTREDFWKWAECRRRAAGLPQERWPNNIKLRDWWLEARKGADVGVLQETYLCFGDQPKWQSATPPLPFAAFMSLWNQYLPRGAPHAS